METYPASIEATTPERIANWRPLVQWLLAIPHLIIANVLQNVAQIIALVSWFAIVFTGRLPEGLANFQCMVLRYSYRAIAYAGFLHDQYPPFDFDMTPADRGDHAITVNFQPELTDRNRLTVGLRFLWLIPIALFTMVIWIVSGICWFLAFFAVLFGGRWPEGLRDWAMRGMRTGLRLYAYAALLTDEYPPFATD